jgi:hypothetical protein
VGRALLEFDTKISPALMCAKREIAAHERAPTGIGAFAFLDYYCLMPACGALYLSKNTTGIYAGSHMQTRPYTDLRRGCLTSARRVPLKCRFPILDEQFCVVTCVVTLASLPVSGEFAPCRSGIDKGQE